jgi:hypothetical protein
MLALTLEKKLAADTVLAELSYRPTQPFQYNPIDPLTAFATVAGATPLRAEAAATAAGERFRGDERHKSLQFNVGPVHGLPALLGAQGGNVGLELACRHVPDLPDPAVTRSRRPDLAAGVGRQLQQRAGPQHRVVGPRLPLLTFERTRLSP